MKNLLMTVSIVTLLAFASSGHALTMKSGQVIGSDGNLYDGASPEMMANLIKNAKQTGKMARHQWQVALCCGGLAR